MQSGFNVQKIYNDLCYRPGDSFNLSGTNCAGYITNSQKQISFNLPVNKVMVDCSEVALSNLKCTIRQGGKYLMNEGTPETVKVAIKPTGLAITFEFAEVVANSTNNENLTIAFASGTATFS